MVEHDASDLHLVGRLAAGDPRPRLLERLPDLPKIEPDDTRALVYRILSTEQQKVLETKRQLDFSYSLPGHRTVPRQRVLPAAGASAPRSG